LAIAADSSRLILRAVLANARGFDAARAVAAEWPALSPRAEIKSLSEDSLLANLYGV
jgi:hypothetical protein